MPAVMAQLHVDLLPMKPVTGLVLIVPLMSMFPLMPPWNMVLPVMPPWNLPMRPSISVDATDKLVDVVNQP